MTAQDLPSNHYDERSGLNNSAGAASIKHRVEFLALMTAGRWKSSKIPGRGGQVLPGERGQVWRVGCGRH